MSYFALIVFSCLITVVYGQMTFSDGWEKRTPENIERGEGTKTAAQTCATDLRQGMSRLQKEIQEVHNLFEKCMHAGMRGDVPRSSRPAQRGYIKGQKTLRAF